jgi:alpha-ribazole phosphatase
MGPILSAGAILVARHAPTAVRGVCYGQSDVPTVVDVDEAAKRLLIQVRRLELGGGFVVWSSPWHRTRGPAERVANELGAPLVIDPRLSELAFGAWEGRSYAELQGEPAFTQWMHDWRRTAPPGGELLTDFLQRVRQWHAVVRRSGTTVLAITHAGVIRALRAELRCVNFDAVIGEAVEPLLIERMGTI